MSSKSNVTSDQVEPVNGFFAGGNRRAAELAKAIPAIRPVKQTTARARISATKTKKGRVAPMGPTPERLAKDDVVRTAAGFHRSIAPVERLRDQGKLDHDSRTNEAMYQAAQKLRRHFDGCLVGVKAQDLNKVIGSSTNDDLTQEEAWVYNFDSFRIACKLMGWSEANPHRGAGRIVVSVVCYETPVVEAAREHVGQGKTEVLMGAAMDRLREGLFALAAHWRMI